MRQGIYMECIEIFDVSVRKRIGLLQSGGAPGGCLSCLMYGGFLLYTISFALMYDLHSRCDCASRGPKDAISAIGGMLRGSLHGL